MMQHLTSLLAAASVLAMAAYPGLAAPSGSDPLAAFRWKARVLVVLASRPDDPQLLAQRSLFAGMGREADERDLALVEGVGQEPKAQALRKNLGLDDQGFYAVLVGKDGGDKLTSATPLGSDALFPLIDSMPMRQQEMQK